MPRKKAAPRRKARTKEIPASGGLLRSAPPSMGGYVHGDAKHHRIVLENRLRDEAAPGAIVIVEPYSCRTTELHAIPGDLRLSFSTCEGFEPWLNGTCTLRVAWHRYVGTKREYVATELELPVEHMDTFVAGVAAIVKRARLHKVLPPRASVAPKENARPASKRRT